MEARTQAEECGARRGREGGGMSAAIEDVNQMNWRWAVMWHGVSMLPRLRGMSPESLKRLLDEANEHNMSEPLHFCHGPRFVVPSWGARKLTGGQVTALLVFGLWVMVGEKEQMASCLLDGWPEIKMACLLAREKETRSEL